MDRETDSDEDGVDPEINIASALLKD